MTPLTIPAAATAVAAAAVPSGVLPPPTALPVRPLNVGTGEVFGECRPTRTGQDFLEFLKKAVRPHAGKEIRVVLDNLSTHTTSEAGARWGSNSQPAD